MHTHRRLALAAAIAFAALAAGCGGGGATSTTQTEVTTVSQGQQLMDLKKALDSGAISQQEYDRLREKVIQGK